MKVKVTIEETVVYTVVVDVAPDEVIEDVALEKLGETYKPMDDVRVLDVPHCEVLCTDVIEIFSEGEEQ